MVSRSKAQKLVFFPQNPYDLRLPFGNHLPVFGFCGGISSIIVLLAFSVPNLSPNFKRPQDFYFAPETASWTLLITFSFPSFLVFSSPLDHEQREAAFYWGVSRAGKLKLKEKDSILTTIKVRWTSETPDCRLQALQQYGNWRFAQHGNRSSQ